MIDLVRIPDAERAVELCRQGLRPREIDRAINGGAGLDYLAKRWKMPYSEMVGLAVYYGIVSAPQGHALARRFYE